MEHKFWCIWYIEIFQWKLIFEYAYQMEQNKQTFGTQRSLTDLMVCLFGTLG